MSHTLLDEQLGSIRKDLNGINVGANVTERDEHIPEVERQIRAIMERAQSAINRLPFTSIPLRMMMELKYGCEPWHNGVPPTD